MHLKEKSEEQTAHNPMNLPMKPVKNPLVNAKFNGKLKREWQLDPLSI